WGGVAAATPEGLRPQAGERQAASGPSELQRLGPGHVEDEYLAVADAAGAGGAGDALGDLADAVVADADADLDLRQEGHTVLAADVAIEVALLPAVALGLAHDAGADAQLGDG